MAEPVNPVVLGEVSAHHGVRGWVKVFSHTRPLENILDYPRWWLRIRGNWQEIEVAEGRMHGKGIIVRFDKVNRREDAETYLKAEIAVARDELPEGDGFYWSDLVGLRVETIDGESLGTVDYLFETGANDVVVVKGDRERLIPWVRDEVVKDVDLEGGLIRVDWDPSF